MNFRSACWSLRYVTTRGQSSARKQCDALFRTTPAGQSDCRIFCSDQSGVAVNGLVIQDALADEEGLWSQLLGRMSFSHSVNLVRVLVNMISVCCILALGLFSSALGRDFQGGENVSGLKRLRREFKSDAVRRSLEKSDLWKRSSGLNEQTCTALPDIESTLQNSTHSVSHVFSCFLTVFTCVPAC